VRGVAVNVPHIPQRINPLNGQVEPTVWTENPSCARDEDAWVKQFVAQSAVSGQDSSAAILETPTNPQSGQKIYGYSYCAVLAVAAPQGTTITRIQTTLAANMHPSRCGLFALSTDTLTPSRCAADPGHPESAGTHASYLTPVVQGRWVGVVFRNWSHDQMRTPFLRVYYK
jgi:hypothetical protein